jgi:hypothetical protein
LKQAELKLQQQCFIWHWNTYPQERGLLHANNNNSENAIKGAMNRSLGVVAGVADMEYNRGSVTVFIEFKSEGGSQRKEQKHFQSQVEAEGFPYHIVRSFQQFKDLIHAYQQKAQRA